MYTKISGNNIVDNLIAGNELNELKGYPCHEKKVLNKVDQTIETELGRLKITDIKILNGVSYIRTVRDKKVIITGEFTPKKIVV